MLDADGISEHDQATHRAGPVDANSNTASLEIDDNGAVDADEEGARAPQVSSVDDESREDDEEEKEDKEEKDDVHEDEHEDDDPGSSEHESTFQSSTPLSLFPCCVFPPTSSQAIIVTFCSIPINRSNLTCCSRTLNGSTA